MPTPTKPVPVGGNIASEGARDLSINAAVAQHGVQCGVVDADGADAAGGSIGAVGRGGRGIDCTTLLPNTLDFGGGPPNLLNGAVGA